jgi:hypothetical protein
MRICIRKSDKRIIGMSSPSCAEGQLIANAAVEFGLTPDEVSELEVDQAGYEAALAVDPVKIAAKQATIDKAAAQAAKIIAISDAKATIATLVPAVDKATDVESLKKVVLDLIKNVQAITA